MSWLWRGKPIRAWTNSFAKFHSVVKDYDELDVGTKSAVIKASSSVVSLISYAGDKPLFIGSGTIIECNEVEGSFIAIILTSATILQGPQGAGSLPFDLKIDVYVSDGNLYEGRVSGYDFHYNIATITIKSCVRLSIATTRVIDDSIAIDPRKPVLVPHRGAESATNRFKLRPGDLVIALSRYCADPHEIMASPGVFSARDCCHDCKELLLTSCTVTKIAVGGPLVNGLGEVIGVNFLISPYNAFLPINIVSKCLESFKKNRQVPRPWLGACVANLYTADLDKLDMLHAKFPHIVDGIIVEQVIGNMKIGTRIKKTKIHHWTLWPARNWLKAKAILGSIRKTKRTKSMISKMKRTPSTMRGRQVEQRPHATLHSLCIGDVIIRCNGASVGSHLEFVDALWKKEGKLVELDVIRPSIGEQKLMVTIGSSPKMHRWCLPENGPMLLLGERLARERKIKLDKTE